MTYNIALFKDGSTDIAERLLSEIGRKFGINFSVDIFKPDERAADMAKRANAVLFEISECSPKTRAHFNALQNALGLYATVRRSKSYPTPSKKDADLDILTVFDAPQTRRASDSGFGNDPAFGREAYDTVRYSELGIERVARVAYELADTRCRHITLADGDTGDNCSRLWRKIVTDINEDYPFVRVDLKHASDVASELTLRPEQFDIILTSATFGETLSRLSSAICNGTSVYATFGDTALGAYGAYDEAGIILSVAAMLRHSMDLDKEARHIETALSQATESVISENADIAHEVISRI